MTFVIVNLVLFGKQRQQVKSRVLSMNFKKTRNQNLPNLKSPDPESCNREK